MPIIIVYLQYMARNSYPSIQAQDCDTVRLYRQTFGDTCGVRILSAMAVH